MKDCCQWFQSIGYVFDKSFGVIAFSYCPNCGQNLSLLPHLKNTIFSKRKKIAQVVDEWMDEHKCTPETFNIITALDILGCLRTKQEFEKYWLHNRKDDQ
jgi:hypothetical protein